MSSISERVDCVWAWVTCTCTVDAAARMHYNNNTNNTNLEVATSAVIVMKLVAPTRSTRFLPNLTLDWLTTAIRSTPGARRTFRSANLKESTTPCSIHSVSGNSPLISWAWVGWGRLCLKSTTYILLSRPNHHQGYKLTETLCFQRDKHLVKPQVAAWVRVAHGVVLNRRWEPVTL